MDRLIEDTDRLSHFPPPFAHDGPQPDEVLTDLLLASEVALRHPEPEVQRLAKAARRKIHDIQKDIRRRLARQRARVKERRIALLIEQIACALRVEPESLRGPGRKLHIAFQRQVASICADVLAAPATSRSAPSLTAITARAFTLSLSSHAGSSVTRRFEDPSNGWRQGSAQSTPRGRVKGNEESR
ncbi:MAG: hypothetical protein JO138_08475 [Acidobacteriaceae bacterium]|nr:hypothetical protein [Acidobacteriaceae bacterium]